MKNYELSAGIEALEGNVTADEFNTALGDFLAENGFKFTGKISNQSYDGEEYVTIDGILSVGDDQDDDDFHDAFIPMIEANGWRMGGGTTPVE